jgi:hypothetical protein
MVQDFQKTVKVKKEKEYRLSQSSTDDDEDSSDLADDMSRINKI